MVNSQIMAFLSFISIGIGQSTNRLQCRDENNEPVDWYVLYKIPKITQSSNPMIREGVAYLYMTSHSIGEGWKLSKQDVTSKSSIPGYTLAPLYEGNNESALWVLYNDKPPDKSSNGKYGHCKGVVMANKEQGFWLVHSVPSFPSTPNTDEEPQPTAEVIPDRYYDYPISGKMYGQSFLCISVDKDQFNVIGQQLMYNQIIPYKINLPEVIARQYPVLRNAINKVQVKTAPYNSIAKIRSLNSMEFTSFAKSDKWQKDLYDDFVAPKLRSNLLTETWLNGRGKLPSDCNRTTVMNVQSVVLEEVNVNFKSALDHSKWAVSSVNSKDRNWVCIGDVNRATTQFDRGGGTVCFNLLEVWKNYRKAVNDIEPCPKQSFSIVKWIKGLFS